MQELNGAFSVVWPAPGYPAIGTGSLPDLTVVLGFPNRISSSVDSLVPSDWHLRNRSDGSALPLAISRKPRVIESDDVPGSISDFARCRDFRGWSFVELELDPPRVPPGRALFDLCSSRGVESPHSVAVLDDGRDLRVAFASDVHVAALWDDVSDLVARYASDLAPGLAHPGTLLLRFVDEANRRARCCELDLVVFGGDLVDHVYAHRATTGRAATDASNVVAFAESIDRLEVPSVVIPGNHDFRLFRWRPRAYGLEAARIPNHRLRAILEPAGCWDPMPIRWSDRLALRTEQDDCRAPLADHLRRLAPSTNFEVRARGVRLVFLNSGRDLLPRWRSVDRSRRRALLRSVPRSWIDPDSEGLDHRQIGMLDEAIRSGDPTAVFCHAPLLASYSRRPIPDLVPELDPDRFVSAVEFEDQLSKSGARVGVLFHGLAESVRLLRSSRAPVTWFSGHVHRSDSFRLRRDSGRVEARNGGGVPNSESDTVDIVQTPALGLHGTLAHDHPGYVLATLRSGRLSELATCRFESRTQLVDSDDPGRTIGEAEHRRRQHGVGHLQGNGDQADERRPR